MDGGFTLLHLVLKCPCHIKGLQQLFPKAQESSKARFWLTNQKPALTLDFPLISHLLGVSLWADPKLSGPQFPDL